MGISPPTPSGVRIGVKPTATLTTSKSRRRRPPVGPCPGVRARAGQNDGLRAVVGLSPTIRRRPAGGPRRRCRLRAGQSAKSPSRRGFRIGGPRPHRNPSRGLHLHPHRPSRHRNSSGPGRRRLLRHPALETRCRAGRLRAPRDSGCPPERQAAIGLPNRATTAALGLGCTTMARPATALRSVHPASANRRRRQRHRMIGGAGIPVRVSRREAIARGPVIPVKTPNPLITVSAETRRRPRQCRLHRLQRHRRHCPTRPTDPTGGR
jgi:hypothetical protein